MSDNIEQPKTPWYKEFTPFKDVFVLKRNSWHTKLMKRIWGYDYYDFTNMCPYFWLSILNVIIAPFYFLGIGIGNAYMFVEDKMSIVLQAYDEYCREREKIWLQKMQERIKNKLEVGDEQSFADDRLLRKLYKSRTDSSYYSKSMDKIWNRLDRDVRNTIYDTIGSVEDKKREIKREKEREQTKVKIEKEVSTRKQIANATIAIKKVAKILGIVLLLFCVYLVWLILKWVVSLNWGHILFVTGKFMGILILCLAALAVAAGIVWSLYLLFRYLICTYGSYCLPCMETRNKYSENFGKFWDGIVPVFNIIAKPFIWFGRGMWMLIGIIIAIKKDNCPAIHWENEDENN